MEQQVLKFSNLDEEKIINSINSQLKEIFRKEILSLKEDVPIALNILKLLELYKTGNFYGTVSIKLVGRSSRNLKITEQSFRIKEEKRQFFLDSSK